MDKLTCEIDGNKIKECLNGLELTFNRKTFIEAQEHYKKFFSTLWENHELKKIRGILDWNKEFKENQKYYIKVDLCMYKDLPNDFNFDKEFNPRETDEFIQKMKSGEAERDDELWKLIEKNEFRQMLDDSEKSEKKFKEASPDLKVCFLLFLEISMMIAKANAVAHVPEWELLEKRLKEMEQNGGNEEVNKMKKTLEKFLKLI